MHERTEYVNMQTFRDGNIILFNRRGAKRPFWHVRIKRPGKQKPKDRYLVQSMRTTNFGEALADAENLYDDMRYRTRNNIPVVEFTVHQLYIKWIKTVGARKNVGRKETIRKAYEFYILPFMGKKKLNEIKPALLNEFWEHRISYWTTGDGSKTKSSFVGTTPRLSTIKQERQSLKQVLRWAYEQDYIHKMPVIPLPEIASTEQNDDKKTPAFTWKQWKILDRFFSTKYLPIAGDDIMEYWARNPKLNTSHLHGRYMLAYFMRIGVNSGLRPHEMLMLQWKHVHHYKDEGEQHVAFNVPKNTKTGARQNVCQPICIKYLQELKECTQFNKPEDYLFTTGKGSKSPSPNSKLKRVLKKLGMQTDLFGNNFIPYSVRHTFITMRLLYGEVSIDALARNLGTSAKMINETYDHVVNMQKTSELTSLKSAKK